MKKRENILSAGGDMSIKSLCWKLFKTLCYLALIIVITGGAALFLPFIFDLCQNQSGGTVGCDAPIYRSIYEYGFTIVMMSVFTGIPILLALIGLVLLIRRMVT